MSALEEKALVARAGAALVRDGMTVGLGTGTTVAQLLLALARQGPRARYVATSPQTAREARALGLRVEEFDEVESLDLALDGADQVADDGWLLKGAGGAHAREKIVAAAAERFVVLVDASKMVSALHPPVALELSAFGLAATLGHLGAVSVRDAPASPDGGVLADYLGEVGEPAQLARRLSAVPGVLAHGLFAPDLVSDVLVANGDQLRRVRGAT